MRIVFVLPLKVISGGVRVLFEYAGELERRGHHVRIVYPVLPLSVNGSRTWKNTARQIRDMLWVFWDNTVQASGFDWLQSRFFQPVFRFDIDAVRNGRAGTFPDADAVVATTWDTAYAVAALPPEKGRKFYLIQSYEMWGLWDNERYWEIARSIETPENTSYFVLPDIVPTDPLLARAKELVDSSFTLPLRKITIASWLRILLERKFKATVAAMIINGVDTQKFYPEQRQPNRDGRVRILMPYRKPRLKGMADGFAALDIVRRRYPQIECTVYGKTKEKEIPAWVRFEPGFPDAHLRHLYSQADVFVLPSWIEGCQLPPMEAMACGCAVAATAVGGIADYAVPGRTVLTSPARNPGALAENIMALVAQPERREAIARDAQRYIQQFTWQKAAAVLEAVLSGKTGGIPGEASHG